jgi:hypothetical protein
MPMQSYSGAARRRSRLMNRYMPQLEDIHRFRPATPEQPRWTPGESKWDNFGPGHPLYDDWGGISGQPAPGMGPLIHPPSKRGDPKYGLTPLGGMEGMPQEPAPMEGMPQEPSPGMGGPSGIRGNVSAERLYMSGGAMGMRQQQEDERLPTYYPQPRGTSGTLPQSSPQSPLPGIQLIQPPAGRIAGRTPAGATRKIGRGQRARPTGIGGGPRPMW